MNTQSNISGSTLQSYRETDFLVYGSIPMTLRVGESNLDLMRLQQTEREQTSAFITACNPLGQIVEDAVNADRQAGLARELEARNLTFIPGVGQHPSNEWPGEASFLVLGLSLEAAKALGAKYEQNAIVWCGSDGVAQLVLLR